MTKLRQLLSLLTVSMLVAVTASCDTASNITAVDSGVEIDGQFANTGANPNANGNANRGRELTRLAWANIEDGEPVGGWFTSGGGTLEIRNEAGDVLVRLVVSGGSSPGDWTRYEMELVEVGGEFAVELSATRWGSPNHNDVGAAGFRKAVKLHINTAYLDATGFDINRLGIAEYLDGTLVRVPSNYDAKTGFIVGNLSHFSAYVPISD